MKTLILKDNTTSYCSTLKNGWNDQNIKTVADLKPSPWVKVKEVNVHIKMNCTLLEKLDFK